MFDSTLGAAAAAAAHARRQQTQRPSTADAPGTVRPSSNAASAAISVPGDLQSLPPRQTGDRLQRLGGAISELFLGRRSPQSASTEAASRVPTPPRPLTSFPFAELVREIDTDIARRPDIGRELLRRLEAAGLAMPAIRQGHRETIELLSGVDWLVLLSEGHVNIAEALDAVVHSTGLAPATPPATPDAESAPGAPLSSRAMQRVRSAIEANLRRISRDHEGVRNLVAPPSPGAPPVTGSRSARR